MPDAPISVLIVEDDADFRDSSARWMQRKGHHVASAASGAEALSLCARQDFDVGVFDMNMPGMSGIELLQRVRADEIDMEVIILTGQGTIETAVQAMKMEASDYLTKPCPLGDLEHHCRLARDRGQLRKENKQLKAIIRRGSSRTDLIGDSPPMLNIAKLIDRIAPTDKPVLIAGESGTGKEVVAKVIQQKSSLASAPFVTVNCAALPEQLVESELFGHQKGAFTGATAEKPGLFEVADGGTLFIDELGEMPLALQPKLLRVLEDGSMRRIGSHKERRVKVRIIAATNRDLGDDVKAGTFREDLFYRVNVLPIDLPPLRERAGDIDLLINHFLPESWHIDPDAREIMNNYDWPGNVRELINVTQRATILADDYEITVDDLPQELTLRSAEIQAVVTPPVSQHDGVKLDDIQRLHVLEVLNQQNGNKAKTARVLGIHRRKLYRLLERFESQETES
ncbi:MAG: sigma-54 dependent transcriptional regulator [Rubripirellula sp.]|nr:sigma-54 dependent transcriptional regulator [Rubripirellula sp.]